MSLQSELHDREHEAFLAEVHSFEFWFQAVDGYLRNRPYGHQSESDDTESPVTDHAALIATLSTYCVGETAALEGASGMIGFAPNHQSKIFLATQVADEARHLEVFLHRMGELGVEKPDQIIEKQANRSLLAFKTRLLELVDARDWEASVFAQNVILESMEFATFTSHMARTDSRTAEMLEGVIKDERRHMGFGENDLGRRLHQSPDARARLSALQKELDFLVLGTFEESLDALSVPRTERPELGRHYLDIVARLGFPQ